MGPSFLRLRNRMVNETSGALEFRAMKTVVALFPLRLIRRSYVVESRVILWNLLFVMGVSSFVLLAYLKRILFNY
jgi:hypothetical protein